MDIIQKEVKDIKTDNHKVEGVNTSKGFIRANKVAVVVGHTSVLAQTAGIRRLTKQTVASFSFRTDCRYKYRCYV